MSTTNIEQTILAEELIPDSEFSRIVDEALNKCPKDAAEGEPAGRWKHGYITGAKAEYLRFLSREKVMCTTLETIVRKLDPIKDDIIVNDILCRAKSALMHEWAIKNEWEPFSDGRHRWSKDYRSLDTHMLYDLFLQSQGK